MSLSVLSQLWGSWASAGRSLSAADWDRPTRVGTWDVRALYAHAVFWPAVVFPGALARVTDAPVTHTAATMLRAFNAPDGVAHTGRDTVASQAVARAAEYSADEMIAVFETAGPAAIASVGDAVSRNVDYFGFAVLPLAEAVKIGVLEATVHLLDLHDALGLGPAASAEGLAEGLAVTTELLTAVASPAELVDALTGRGRPVLS